MIITRGRWQKRWQMHCLSSVLVLAPWCHLCRYAGPMNKVQRLHATRCDECSTGQRRVSRHQTSNLYYQYLRFMVMFFIINQIQLITIGSETL